MSDQTEAARLAQQRIDDKLEAAEARGAAAERTRAQLGSINLKVESHEQRLKAINGSVERAADETKELKISVKQLVQNMAQLSEHVRTREAVAEALTKAVQAANDQQISTRAFGIGVAAVVVAILALIATLLVGVHAI